jgi:uncharacterized DUF497 family protein
MADLRFEWDPAKAAANVRKHGVSFDEAETAFSDEHALLLDDPELSADDDRFILIGLSAALRMVVLCHCYHEGADVIRLISARKATRTERRDYAARW